MYAKSDSEIDQVLALTELAIRSNVNTQTRISPYECERGIPMPLFGPIIEPDWSKIPLTTDPLNYVKWLIHRLSEIWKAVKTNSDESKQEMKITYDKRHKVDQNQREFVPGDKVLLQNTRTKPGHVVTHRKFQTKPFYILQKVQNDNIELPISL